MGTLDNFLTHLRQKKIGQTVVVYLGSAWVILEAFGFFAQRYGWDQRLFDAFLILLLFGLPAVALFRWFQDATTPSARRKNLYLNVVNFALAIFFVGFTWDAAPAPKGA